MRAIICGVVIVIGAAIGEVYGGDDGRKMIRVTVELGTVKNRANAGPRFVDEPARIPRSTANNRPSVPRTIRRVRRLRAPFGRDIGSAG